MKERSKKWKVLLLLLPLVLGSYYGCKKEITETLINKERAIDLERVKRLYSDGHVQDRLVQRLEGIEDIVWLPDWKSATTKVRDSSTFTYIRLRPAPKDKSSKRTVLSDNSKHYLVLKDGEEFQRAIYIQKTEGKERPTDRFSFEHFNGTLILEQLKTGNKVSYRFKDGRYVGRPISAKGLSSADRPGTTMYYDYQCNTVYYCTFAAYCHLAILIHYDDSGNCSPPWYPPSWLEGSNCYDDFWNQTSTDMVMECENVWVDDPPPNPGDDGEGSTGGDPEVNLTYEVTDSLTDECKQQALADISDTEVKNFITGFYSKFMLPKDGKIDLLIKEGSSLVVNNKAAVAFSVDTTPIPPAGSPAQATHTWEMTLSSSYFSGSGYDVSKEVWGLIIAHEILHIVIQENGMSTLVGNNDHVVMFAKFVEPTRDLLHDAFGISQDDALKLALTGMKDLWGYSDFAQICQQKYGVSLAQIDATYDSYTKGIGGTKCNGEN